MNFRLTTVLIGAVLLIGTGLLVRTFFLDPPAPDTLLVGLGGAKAEDIDEVVIERTDSASTLKFKRIANDDWEITEPIRAKANGAAVKAVVESLLKAKPSATAFAEAGTNPATRGLQPPGLKITLRQGDQRSGALNIGNVSSGGAAALVFVSTTAKPDRPIAVGRRDLEALFRQDQVAGGGKAGDLAKWTPDYRASAVFPSDSRAVGEDVASVRLELPNKKKEVALSRTLGGGWKFDNPAGWGDADVEGDAAGSATTFTGVRRLLGALTSVSAASPGDFIDQPKDLKEYGLNADNPDLVKVEMKTRDGQSAIVYFGKHEAGLPPMPRPGMPPSPPGGKVYVRVEGQPGVISATSGDLAGLNSVVLDPSPLRDRTLVNMDRAKVDGIDIVLAGQPPTKLRFAGQLPQWQLYGGPGDPQLAYGDAVQKLLDVVFARRSIKDFPPPNPANFAAISATLFVWSGGFTPATDPKAEPTKKTEPTKIEFGRKDGDTLYVRRTLPGLPPNEFTIPAQMKVGIAAAVADVVTTVGLSRLDLIDRGLPSFADAARIAVTGANTYTLARDEKPDALTKEQLWRYDPTDPRKGQVVDGGTVRNELIYRLANANSSFGRFIEEDPKPEKLAEYGLAPPRLKVVVDLPPNTEPKQITFEFGKDYPADPDKVYAKISGRPAVFTVQRRVFDACAKPDLRDRVIFRAVDLPAVNKVELKGWGTAGFVTELTFEKNKDGAWAATKAPAGFVVDSAKVSAFVDHLVREQVKTFEKGPPQGLHEFHDLKQALQITLHWPGGAVAINLGATPDNGATYYGWSSWLPQTDPVFTIDGAFFKPYKASSGAFVK